MAFKLDFTKLSDSTPEERAADDARLESEARAREIREREAKVKHTRTVTITEELDARFTMDGSREFHFQGTDGEGRPIRGHYLTLSGIERSESEGLVQRFSKGQTVTLRGYFRPWTPEAGPNKGKTQFRFVGLFLD